MAGPYSGASLAADALSRAISDMFKGMVQGQDRAAQIELQQEEIGKSRRNEAIEQAFLPQRYRKGELDISGAEVTQEGQRITQRGQLQEQQQSADAHPLMQHNRRLGNEMLQHQIQTEQLRPKLMQLEMQQTEAQIKALEQQMAHAAKMNPLAVGQLEQQIQAAKADYGHKVELYRAYTQGRAQLPAAVEALANTTGNTQAAIGALFKYGHIFIDAGMAQHPAFRMLLEQIEAASPGSNIMRAVVDDAARLQGTMTQALIGNPKERPFTSEELLVQAWIQKYALASTLKTHTGSLVHPQQGALTIPPMPKYLQDKLSTPQGQQWWRGMTNALGITEAAPPPAMTKDELQRALPYIQSGDDFSTARSRGMVETPVPTPAPTPEAPKPVTPPKASTAPTAGDRYGAIQAAVLAEWRAKYPKWADVTDIKQVNNPEAQAAFAREVMERLKTEGNK